MKKKKLIEFIKKPSYVALFICSFIIGFLSVSNFNLVKKNNKYKEYLTETIFTLEQYEKEVQEINDAMLRLRSEILKCKG